VRRGSLVQLLFFAAVAGGIGVALAILPNWLPDAASREAGRIHFVFWFVTGICVFIFAIVAAVLAYAVLKFRRAPDDDSDGPPIHGHTGLEIAWTAVPTLLVTAIAIVSAIVLAKDDAAGADPLRVDVVAQQFAWSFYYGCDQASAAPVNCGKESNVLRLPVNGSVVLHMTSKDVIHSFWVPQFSQKQDLVPGIHPTLHITPDKVGTYPVVCTELCGLGHALMRSQAVVMPAAAFRQWLNAKAGAGGGQAAGTGAGLAVFKAQGCGACHTLRAAGATGTIGPDLDKLQAEASRAGQALAAFVHTSIVSPNAYVEKGFPPGVMPQNFAQSLSGPELTSLVQFLVASAKKGSS
jgi:cytochrome c oxidase subunit II